MDASCYSGNPRPQDACSYCDQFGCDPADMLKIGCGLVRITKVITL